MTGMISTIGEFLRKTRTERGISLEQVSQATRVKVEYLQAIEHNDPADLPSVVHARGFLRLYASFLDLPAQPLLDGWESGQYILPDTSEPAGETVAEETPAEEEPSRLEEFVPAPEMEEEFSEPDESVSPPVEKRLSQQIFIDIGGKLRQRRQELSLSIADIERFTRLRAFYIEALEDGRVEDLPSMVQGRGMLSNYAEFLDLNVDGLMDQFADALQTRRVELSSPQPPPTIQGVGKSPEKISKAQPASWRRFITLDLVLGTGLFILLIGFVLWGASRVTNIQRQAEVPTPPSISEILMTPNGGLPSSTPEVLPTATPGQALANTLPAGIAPGTAEQETENSLPTLSSAPISVYIVASQRAWMRVTVDTSVVFDGRVSPGNAYPFTGRERIDLLTGNGAALSVVYNENNLGTLGTMGEVVSISFTREGTTVPTPVFTVTPTQTPQPTATLQPTLPQITPSITPFIP